MLFRMILCVRFLYDFWKIPACCMYEFYVFWMICIWFLNVLVWFVYMFVSDLNVLNKISTCVCVWCVYGFCMMFVWFLDDILYELWMIFCMVSVCLFLNVVYAFLYDLWMNLCMICFNCVWFVCFDKICVRFFYDVCMICVFLMMFVRFLNDVCMISEWLFMIGIWFE